MEDTSTIGPIGHRNGVGPMSRGSGRNSFTLNNVKCRKAPEHDNTHYECMKSWTKSEEMGSIFLKRTFTRAGELQKQSPSLEKIL